MTDTHLLSQDKFPVVYDGDKPTAVMVDMETFHRLQFIFDNLLEREGEPEDAVISASEWLKQILAGAEKTIEAK